MLIEIIRRCKRTRSPRAGADTYLLSVGLPALLFVVLFAAVASVARPAAGSEAAEKGLRIRFTVDQGHKGRVVAGDPAEVRLAITDAATGEPVSALKPAVWLDRIRGDRAAGEAARLSCTDKVRTYVKGSLSLRPDIDLNSYYILSMNDDASISVINPLVGVTGKTQLYKMALLRKPGEDWVEGPGGRTLYVTMPEAGEVAVVGLDDFKVTRNVSAGRNPGRIALQPDLRYLWVANNDDDENGSGVTVIDPVNAERKSFVRTGPGSHEIAFSGDSLFAFVSNSLKGTVSVIDTQKLRKTNDLTAGGTATYLAYSTLADALYAVNRDEGTVAVIDGSRHEIVARIQLKPGSGQIRFAPGGRWAFVVNSSENMVSVLDASDNTVVRSIDSVQAPERVFFSDTFAYITSGTSSEVTLIQLSEISVSGPLAATKIYAGQKSGGASALRSAADPVVQAGERGAILIANPVDKTVYYYMEGMEVPMGSFKGYGRAPKAVRIAGRNITEKARGVYSAPVTLPAAGPYEAVVLIDSPKIVQCFEFEAELKPGITAEKEPLRRSVTMLTQERSFRRGEQVRFAFSLSEGEGITAGQTDQDVIALVMRMPGTWQERGVARHLGDGQYEVKFTFPADGTYHLYLGSAGLGLPLDRPPYLVMNVKGGIGDSGEGAVR